MKLYNRKVLILFLVLLINGCGSTSMDEREVELGEEQLLSSTDVSTTFSEESFTDGTISKDIIIPITSTDGREEGLGSVAISSGTQFTDEEGEVVDNAPTLTLLQSESSTTIKENEASKTSQVVKSELKFSDKDGNKIIPTEAVEITMPAPRGSKPGDEVTVEIPNGDIEGEETQKLTLFIVDKDGNIRLVVLPHVFESLDVVIVIVERVVVLTVVQPLTGAEGSN